MTSADVRPIEFEQRLLNFKARIRMGTCSILLSKSTGFFVKSGIKTSTRPAKLNDKMDQYFHLQCSSKAVVTFLNVNIYYNIFPSEFSFPSIEYFYTNLLLYLPRRISEQARQPNC